MSGDYAEELHGEDDQALSLKGVAAGSDAWISIPSNYARIWTLETG
jgi:hypothetical protein